MRECIENIFSIPLPFGNDIKYNIYKQMYKKWFTIPIELQKDIKTFFLLDNIINTYKEKIINKTINYYNYMYTLYSDILVHHHTNTMSYCKDELFNPQSSNCYEADETHNNNNNNRHINTASYQYLVRKIKQFWLNFTPSERMNFITLMRLKFI